MEEVSREELAHLVSVLKQRGLDDASVEEAILSEGIVLAKSERQPRASTLGDVRNDPEDARDLAASPGAQKAKSNGGGFLSTLGRGVRSRIEGLEVGGQELVAGAGSAVEGIGSTLSKIQVYPAPQVGTLLKGAGQAIGQPAAERAEATRLSRESPTLRGDFWDNMAKAPVSTLLDNGLTQVPQVLGVIAAGGAGLPTMAARAGSAWMLEAGAARQQAIRDDASEEEANLAMAITGTANMFLEVKGVDRILGAVKGPKEGVKKFFVDLGKAMLAEGSTESVQEFNQNLTSLAVYAGERGFGLDDLQELFSVEALKQYGAAFLLGAVTGGGMTTVLSAPGMVPRRKDAKPELQQRAEALVEKESGDDADAPLPQEVAEPAPEPRPGDSVIQTEERVVPALIEGAEAKLTPESLAALPTGEGVQGTPVGRPDLANPAETQRERDLITAMQQERHQLDPTQPRPHAVVWAEAKERLETNGFKAEYDRYLAHGAKGDTDTAVARKLIQQASEEGLRTGKTEDLAVARRLVEKYYDEGTADARGFRFRRDFMMDPDERARQHLRDSLLLPSQTLVEELEAAKDQGADALLEAENKYANEINEVRRMIIEQGIDLDALLSGEGPLSDHQKRLMWQAAIIASTSRSTTQERVIEFWRNGILSGLKTASRNMFGNTGFLVWEQTIQRPLEAAIAKIPGLKNDKTLTGKQLMAANRALFDPVIINKAVNNALQAFVQERPVLSEQLGDPDSSKRQFADVIKRPGVAIPGEWGRVFRLPQRNLLAADEFAKTMVVDSELAGIAERDAPKMGVTVESLLENPTPGMMEEAYEMALYRTFQTPLGKLGNQAHSFRKAFPLVGTLTIPGPFLLTPGNLLKLGARKSPLGTGRLLWKYAKLMHGTRFKNKNGELVYPKNEQVRDLAEQIIAQGIFLGILHMAPDPDDPWITGTASSAPAEREFAYRNAPPMSIRVGRRLATSEDVEKGIAQFEGQEIHNWLSYDGVEPFSLPLAWTVDGILSIQRLIHGNTSWEKEGLELMESLVGFVRHKSYLRGIADIFDAFNQAARGDAGSFERWAGNFVTSWVPNIIRSTARSNTPFLAERRPSGEGAEWRADALRSLGEQAFPFGDPSPIRHDIWGKPIRTDEPFGHPATDFMWRVLSPIRHRNVAVSPIDQMIRRYNWQAEKEWHPRLPKSSFTNNGKTVHMTRSQYQEWLKRSGVMAHQTLMDDIRDDFLDLDNPTEKDIGLVKRRIRQAQEQIKRDMGLRN